MKSQHFAFQAQKKNRNTLKYGIIFKIEYRHYDSQLIKKRSWTRIEFYYIQVLDVVCRSSQWLSSSNNIPTLDTDNQRVIIKVKDINDEPPYFINRPLPMQAVVKLNAPPNTPVFTLQAKDPDTDHNLHYFLVRDRSQYLNIISCIFGFGFFEAEGLHSSPVV